MSSYACTGLVMNLLVWLLESCRHKHRSPTESSSSVGGCGLIPEVTIRYSLKNYWFHRGIDSGYCTCKKYSVLPVNAALRQTQHHLCPLLNQRLAVAVRPSPDGPLYICSLQWEYVPVSTFAVFASSQVPCVWHISCTASRSSPHSDCFMHFSNQVAVSFLQ